MELNFNSKYLQLLLRLWENYSLSSKCIMDFDASLVYYVSLVERRKADVTFGGLEFPIETC